MKIAKKCYSIVVYILWKKVGLLFKSAFRPYKNWWNSKMLKIVNVFTLSSIFKA